ncbi:MAG TPA: hypothetical protein VK325_11455, partial [Pseudoxanthomonas sp.]|nr:hypothetical protein [Pseudoxanthomonas sp.]
ITPSLRMAILQPTQGGESVRLKVGESPPSMAQWQLADVQPRSVSFNSSEGPRTLELRVFNGTGGQAPTPVAPPPVAPPMAPPPVPSGAPAAPSDAVIRGQQGKPGAAASNNSAAAEQHMTTDAQMDAIRQRIEARRAQIRAAERDPSQNNTQ